MRVAGLISALIADTGEAYGLHSVEAQCERSPKPTVDRQ
jgi:hypothetical protein